jgi:hypothetical protein
MVHDQFHATHEFPVSFVHYEAQVLGAIESKINEDRLKEARPTTTSPREDDLFLGTSR